MAKKIVVLSFTIKNNILYNNSYAKYYDKIDSKYANYTAADFINDQVRVVPQAHIRHGSYVGKNVILMPSFINIGAYICNGTMVDTWATVGSCAQIGNNLHLSGGVGISGVFGAVTSKPNYN